MAKKTSSFIKDITPEDEKLEPILDQDLDLYNLTDLFFVNYNYHSNVLASSFTDYSIVSTGTNKDIVKKLTPISRFGALKRIEASVLGSRPYPSQIGVDISRPNQSYNYMKWFLKYVALPFKAVLSEDKFVKIQVNRTLYDEEKLSEAEQEQQTLEQGGQGNAPLNADISDAVSDAFNMLLKESESFEKAHDEMPRRIVQDGFVAFIHSDLDWRIRTIQALDLITEPQATCNPDTWSSFFVIRRMSAAEAVEKIQDKTKFWNPNALRWALESARNNRSLVDHRHYQSLATEDSEMAKENFAIRSFYSDKSSRIANVSAYYGSFYVIEGYTRNKEGKIDKTVFFPSTLFLGVTPAQRKARLDKRTTQGKQADIDGADVLFRRKNAYETMAKAITIIPFDRSEPILERQRAHGHDLFSLVENIMRADSAITNAQNMMGEAFYKDANEGNDASNPEDIEIEKFGGMTNIGPREFIENPFPADLQEMMAVRNLYLSQAASLCALGGLDNLESAGEGRGADLAEQKLVRDGRVHKHDIVYFLKGLKSLYSKSFRSALDTVNKGEDAMDDDPLLKYNFYEQLTKVMGYAKTFLTFDKKEIIPETHLPYWMKLHPISIGAGSFGPAERIILNEVKMMTGDSLSQQQLQNLNKTIIRSLVGSQESIDILGTDQSNKTTSSDQVHEAQLETASIIGSADTDAMKYVPIPVRMDKDDHVVHLKDSHNPKAQEYIQALQNVDFAPASLEQSTTDDLASRNSQILSLAALASHISEHQQALEKFGHSRRDVNQLKEETNNILQTSEALLKNLQLTMRALTAKRQDEALRLQNISPENEAEKMKQQTAQQKLQLQSWKDKNQLSLANKIASDNQKRHMDTQLTKARDRASKEKIAQMTAAEKKQTANQGAVVDLHDIREASRLKEKEIAVKKQQGLGGGS